MSIYTPKTPPDDSLAPCYPSAQMLVCSTCARFRRGDPLPVDVRQFVVIDASVLRRPGQPCLMHEARPTSRSYFEPIEHEEFAA